jgi:hypothetical protein
MEEPLNLFYDHYKDSVAQVKSEIVKRERYFVIAVLFLFASILTSFDPSYVQNVVNAAGKSELKIDFSLTLYTINSLFVFLSLWYIVRYYQTVLTIENLYIYVHKVEERLSSSLRDFSVTREGKSYLTPYGVDPEKWTRS